MLPSQNKTYWGRPEGAPKVLTSRTYREPSGNFQGINTIIDDLMKRNCFFSSNSPCTTYLFLFFAGK